MGTDSPDDLRAVQAEALELLAEAAYDDDAITEVIRPSAILPEGNARAVLAELTFRDVRSGGLWLAEPACWRRYDRPWTTRTGAVPSAHEAELIGSIQVAYGTPTRYEITIYRVTVTRFGADRGWTVTSLCDEALGFGDLSLARCPRADLQPPPKAFRMR